MLTVDFLYRINEFVIALALLAVLVAITGIGYRQGRAASEHYEAAGKTQLSTSLVILVIIDLDRPRRGLIEVSQQGMLQLRERMKSSP